MTWIATPPTTPGLYWMLEPGAPPRIIEVHTDGRHPYFFVIGEEIDYAFPGGPGMEGCEPGTEFLGPIQPPE